MSLGPYALALSYILTNAKSNSNSKVQFVYRGLRIPKQVFVEQFGNEGPDINISDFS